MKNKKVLILSVLIILIAIATTISISYAYWATIKTSKDNIITSSCLNIEFKNITNDINLNRTYPKNYHNYDSLEANEIPGTIFTITNNCDNAVAYELNLDMLEGTDLDPEYINFYYYGVNIGDARIEYTDNLEELNEKYGNIVVNKEPFINRDRSLINLRNVSTTIDNAIYSKNLYKGKINGNESHLYYIEASLDGNIEQGEAENKTWLSKIVVNSKPYEQTKAYLKENVFKNIDYKSRIYYIYESDSIDENNPNIFEISEDDSEYPVYAWYADEPTRALFYYTDADEIVLTSDSFENYINLRWLDSLKFNTSKMTTMERMFAYCKYLNDSLNLSNFDTSNVTDMSMMFYDCETLTSLDLSNFDTSKVTNMYGMFSNCNSLTNIDISNFNTSNVISMGNMFYGCSSLKTLDLSNFDISNLQYAAGMFLNSHLDDINLSSFIGHTFSTIEYGEETIITDYEMLCTRSNNQLNLHGYVPSENATYCQPIVG